MKDILKATLTDDRTAGIEVVVDICLLRPTAFDDTGS
jgi:hypothetical protein